MSLFFWLFTFAINLHRIFVTADVTAVFVNIQHGIKRRGQYFNILIKSLYLKGYTAQRLTEEFPEKRSKLWTRRGVNKLLKTLWDTGTVYRRPEI